MKSMMSYPKSVRLNRRKDFDALLRDGATYYNAVFKVYCLIRAAEPGSVCASEAGSVRAAEPGSGAERGGFAPDLAAAELTSTETSTETAQNVDGNRQPSPEGCRFAVSVPKKSFKRAVKRNLLKRRTREAIRLNRAMLPAGFNADFLFFYRSGEVLDYSEIERAVIDAFQSVPQKAAGKCNAGGSDSNLLSEVQSDNGNE